MGGWPVNRDADRPAGVVRRCQVKIELGDYPGMVRVPDDQAEVTGEVWAVDTAGLAGLDQLEGVNEGLYERVGLKLAPPFADDPVETYLYLRSLEGRLIIGSVWREQ